MRRSAASAGSTPANSASSNPKLLDSPWTLQEARIIYEIAARKTCTATDLVRALGLDAGYLSRTLQTLQRRQIVARKPSKTDRRAAELALTAKGRTAFAELDGRSRSEVAGLIGKLDPAGRAAAVVRDGHDRADAGAIGTATGRLPAADPSPRRHRVDNLKARRSICGRNMAGTSAFEALAAEIAAQFIRSYDASREQCWIAEIGGEPVGSVFLVKAWTTSQNCACCWWSGRRAGSASDAR